MTGRILFVLALIALAGPVFGAASGLNIIPTADVLDRGSAAIELERAGEKVPLFAEADAALLLQLGLGYGVEAGYDNFSDGNDFNAWNIKKAVLYRDGSPVAAIGIQNIGKGLGSQPYAVGHIPLGCGRLHAGLIKTEETFHPMAGYDHPITDRIILQADYTAGDENAASLGLVFKIKHNFELTTACIRDNSGSNKSSYLLTISWYP